MVAGLVSARRCVAVLAVTAALFGWVSTARAADPIWVGTVTYDVSGTSPYAGGTVSINEHSAFTQNADVDLAKLSWQTVWQYPTTCELLVPPEIIPTTQVDTETGALDGTTDASGAPVGRIAVSIGPDGSYTVNTPAVWSSLHESSANACSSSSSDGSWFNGFKDVYQGPGSYDGHGHIAGSESCDGACSNRNGNPANWNGTVTWDLHCANCGSTLEVKELTVPSSDPGRFNLTVDGVVKKIDAQSGDTTGQLQLDGSHIVGEDAGTGTSLGDYTSTVSCVDTDNANAVIASATGTSTSVDIPANHHVLCTITNTSAIPLNVVIDGAGDASITSSVGGINCPATCQATLPKNTQVVLTEHPGTGTFINWTGPACSGSATPTCTLTLSQAMTMTAHFSGCGTHVGSATPEYTGRVKIPAAPDIQLYDFQVAVTYCWTGTSAKITRITPFGNIGNGKLISDLEFLGFTPTYDASKSTSFAAGANGDASGNFSMVVNVGQIILNIGLGAAAEKIMAERIIPALTVVIDDGLKGEALVRWISNQLATLVKQMDAAFTRGLYTFLNRVPLPGFIEQPLVNLMLKTFVDDLEAFKASTMAVIKDLFAKGEDISAQHLGSTILNRLEEDFAKMTEWSLPMWQPTVYVSASPRGNLTVSEDGYANPFLTIARIH